MHCVQLAVTYYLIALPAYTQTKCFDCSVLFSTHFYFIYLLCVSLVTFTIFGLVLFFFSSGFVSCSPILIFFSFARSLSLAFVILLNSIVFLSFILFCQFSIAWNAQWIHLTLYPFVCRTGFCSMYLNQMMSIICEEI